MADKVGRKTGLVTNYGRPVYEMEDGSRVSEISDTFKYKGKIINIPTIHGGRQYSQSELIKMLDANDIKPTSTHSTFEEAEKAARERSDNMTMHKAKASGGVMMAQQGQTMLPMTQATSAPQGGGPKAANPAAVTPLVEPQQQSGRPGEGDPRDGAVQEVAAEMQKRQAPPQPAIQQVGQDMVMPTPPAQPQTGGLAAPAQQMAPPMMAKGGMKDDAPEGLAVMIGLGAPTPSYEEAAEGNPPLGATKEEVADDQLVLLSEGELVVPANVVRYHGLGAYEGMRREALMGLQEMENSGQIEYVSGGKKKADPIDDDGGLVKAQRGVVNVPRTGLGQNLGDVGDVPEAASARFITNDRKVGSPGLMGQNLLDTTPLSSQEIDPETGLPIIRAAQAAQPDDAITDDGKPFTPTFDPDLQSIYAPNVGSYKESPEEEEEEEEEEEDTGTETEETTTAPPPREERDEPDNNASNITASAAHGYQNVSTNLKGLAKGILGPFGNLLGGDEGTKKNVYGQVAVGTGAVYGEANVPGADGGKVSQGHNPITGQRMPVFSDRPSGEFFAQSAGKALGLKGSEDFRPFNEPLDYNNPSPLGAMGIASTLDKAISNTKGRDITQFQGAAQERMTAEGQTYAPQDITAEMLGFDKSKASYTLAANNSGKIGNETGDIVATSTSVGVLNDSNQIVTNQGTVVQVTFKDGSKGSLLGNAAENKTVIERYNEEKGYRESGVGYSRGQVDPGLAAAVDRQNRQTDEALSGGGGRGPMVGQQVGPDAFGVSRTRVAFEPPSQTDSDDDNRPSGRQYGGFDRQTVQEETQKTQESYEEAAGINQPAPEPEKESDSGGGGGGGKVICTAMHEMAGFGSYRNKLWQTYAKKAYRNDNVQLGYHKVFADMAKTMYNKPTLAKVLGYFARNRTVYIRNKMRNKPNSLGSIILWNTVEGGLYLLGAAIARGWIKKKKL